MEPRQSKLMGAVMAAVLAVSAGAFLSGPRVLAANDGDHSDSDGRGLAGVWRVTVTPYDCATGKALSPPFESMLTLARGGTVSGTTSSLLYAAGQRSPDHGVWSHKEGRAYRATSEAYILFDSPAGSPLPLRRSTQRITQDITFDEDQPDTFASDAIVQYLSLPGRHVVATGCADAVGHRFE
jgi:hypothetical protein